jgi:hypothetical protein
MDPLESEDFNHVCRSYNTPEGLSHYSIIADSEVLQPEASSDRVTAMALRLLEKAKRYFGGRLAQSSIWWYYCVKTGFPAKDERLDYSYYAGPRWNLDSPQWDEVRHGGREEVSNLVRDFVNRDSPQAVEAPIRFRGMGLRLGDSSWALRKALHFAVLRKISANRSGDLAKTEAAVNAFAELRDYAVKRTVKGPLASPNFLCIVPGKFSLFPSLAHQVYLELEIRGVFKNSPVCTKDDPSPRDGATVEAMIAPPRAEMLQQRGTPSVLSGERLKAERAPQRPWENKE